MQGDSSTSSAATEDVEPPAESDAAIAESVGGRPFARAQRLTVGSWVRIDAEGGSVSWTGHISYINGEILGLRGATSAEDLFTMRDDVTMNVGRDEIVVSSQARVLAASGRMLRILIRRAVGDMERRRARRIRVTQRVSVARERRGCLDRFDAQLIDLSPSGCALCSDTAVRTSDRVSVAMSLDGGEIQVSGEVVRTWRTEACGPVHAGVSFDAITPRQAMSISRFLVGQLRLHQLRDY